MSVSVQEILRISDNTMYLDRDREYYNKAFCNLFLLLQLANKKQRAVSQWKNQCYDNGTITKQQIEWSE